MGKKQKAILPALFALTVTLFELSTDIYVPSLPEMTSYFETLHYNVQLTIGAYLLGFSFPGLLAGPASDGFGRRPVILVGAFIFLLGSLLCILSDSLVLLIMGRFIQGIGAAVGMVVFTALIKDSYNETACSRLFSLMAMVIALSPMLAPILGAYVASEFGWKANFILIGIVATIMTLSTTLYLPEGLSLQSRIRFSTSSLLEGYKVVFSEKKAVYYMIISALTWSSLWVWIIEAPYYMIDVIGLSKVDFGYLSIISPGAYIIGTWINAQVVGKYGLRLPTLWGLRISFTGLIMVLLALLLDGMDPYVIYGFLSLFGFGIAPIFANAVTKAVDVKESFRGSASAMLTTFEMVISAITAVAVSIINQGDMMTIPVIVMLGQMLIAYLLFHHIQKFPTKAG